MKLSMQNLHRHCFRTFASDKVQCKVHCCILIVWVYVRSFNLFNTASTTFQDLNLDKTNLVIMVFRLYRRSVRITKNTETEQHTRSRS